MEINWYPGHMAKSKRLLMDQPSRLVPNSFRASPPLP